MDIRPNKPAKRHVPATPKISDAQRPQWRKEVQREHDAQHARYSRSHVAVSREVEVDLECVGQRRAPAEKESWSRSFVDGGEDGIDPEARRIRQHGLLKEPKGKQHRTDKYVLRSALTFGANSKLRADL